MANKSCIDEKLIGEIADALQQQGFILLEAFLPKRLATQLMQEAQILSSKHFQPAGIGRNNNQQMNTQVRTDSTLWLSSDSALQSEYLDWMEQLRVGLNRRLFMGLFDFESHFSHYAQGDFYRRHLDAFKGRSNRILSTVYYMNQNWGASDGGELLLYADEQSAPLLRVLPVFNSCIIFLSDTFPHEVLTSRRDRYSIAGWYRLNSNSTKQLDPAR